MTKESILTKLANNGGLDIKEEKPYKSNSDVDNIFPISYREAVSGEVESDLKHFELIKRGAEYKYHKGVPAILRDTPKSPPRDFHLTDQEIKTSLENAHTGWKVLKINKSRDGDLDRVTVKASAGTNVVTKTYIVWKDGANIEYKEEA